MKRIIRLTESELKTLVMKSALNVLKEDVRRPFHPSGRI